MYHDVVPFAVLFAVHSLFVAHRRFALATNAIASEFSLRAEEIGWLLTAHAIALTISKLLMGAAADVLQPRRLLLIPLLGLAASSIVLSSVDAKIGLSTCVVVSAALQGAAWPVAVGYLQRWFDPSRIGVWFSLLSSTTTVAGLNIAYTAAFPWREVAFRLGLSSIVVAAVAWTVLESGEQSSEGKKEEGNGGKGFTASLSMIFSCGEMWQLALLYATAMEVRTISETWLPHLVLDPTLSSALQYYFEIGGLIGSVLSGVVVDGLAKWLQSAEKAARFLLLGCCSTMLIVCSMLVIEISDPASPPSHLSVSSMSCLSGTLVYSTINIACLATAQMPDSPSIRGTLTAVVSFLAQLGSVVAGTPVAILLSSYGRAALAPFLTAQLIVALTVAYRNRPFVMKIKAD